jgi:hypothetical protein
MLSSILIHVFNTCCCFWENIYDVNKRLPVCNGILDDINCFFFVSAGLLYDTLPSVTVVSPSEPHPTTASASKVTSAAHLAREPSVQSDVTSHTGSHCSSVESYLESRRPDPEEILLGLGFGGPVGGAGGVDTELSRIPRRFLQPSKVR